MMEVVVETLDESGNVTHTELVRRHTLYSEAVHTYESMRRSIAPERLDVTHRVVMRPWVE